MLHLQHPHKLPKRALPNDDDDIYTYTDTTTEAETTTFTRSGKIYTATTPYTYTDTYTTTYSSPTASFTSAPTKCAYLYDDSDLEQSDYYTCSNPGESCQAGVVSQASGLVTYIYCAPTGRGQDQPLTTLSPFPTTSATDAGMQVGERRKYCPSDWPKPVLLSQDGGGKTYMWVCGGSTASSALAISSSFMFGQLNHFNAALTTTSAAITSSARVTSFAISSIAKTSPSSRARAGTIAGAVIGSLGILAILSLLGFLIFRYRRARRQDMALRNMYPGVGEYAYSQERRSSDGKETETSEFLSILKVTEPTVLELERPVSELSSREDEQRTVSDDGSRLTYESVGRTKSVRREEGKCGLSNVGEVVEEERSPEEVERIRLAWGGPVYGGLLG